MLLDVLRALCLPPSLRSPHLNMGKALCLRYRDCSPRGLSWLAVSCACAFSAAVGPGALRCADPRFEPTSGKLNDHMFKQAYKFVDDAKVQVPAEQAALVAWRKEEREKVAKVSTCFARVVRPNPTSAASLDIANKQMCGAGEWGRNLELT